jgi:hypothetical protein
MNGDLYRTRYYVDVLHEGLIPAGLGLRGVINEGYEGSYVLDYHVEAAEKLSRPAMAAALIEAGSEPAFFNIEE